MLDVDESLLQAAASALSRNRPFALVQYPDGVAEFLDLTGADAARFRPSAFPEAGCKPFEARSTSFDDYARAVYSLVAELEATGGKAVVSRLISLTAAASPVAVAATYFEACPGTFRALFLTPATGLWILATPELLLRRTADGTLFTMSLAGTRPVGTDGEWDDKNRREHDYVTRHITATMRAHGLSPVVAPPCSLPFGSVEHLCERITATGDADFDALLADLSPTPAVCGYPTADALRQIDRCESHPRGCYGGYIAVSRGEEREAYVTLRCARITPAADGSYTYSIFAGGGITSQSEACCEWREADAKAAPLLNAINHTIDNA